MDTTGSDGPSSVALALESVVESAAVLVLSRPVLGEALDPSLDVDATAPVVSPDHGTSSLVDASPHPAALTSSIVAAIPRVIVFQ